MHKPKGMTLKKERERRQTCVFNLGKRDPATSHSITEKKVFALLAVPGLSAEDSLILQKAYRNHQTFGTWTPEQYAYIVEMWERYPGLKFRPFGDKINPEPKSKIVSWKGEQDESV